MSSLPFAGKRAIILGIANERSIAWGIAQALHAGGAKLAFNYMGPALERRVRPLAEKMGPAVEILGQCDVSKDEELDSFFGQVREKWDSADILIHSIGFAPREALEGRFVDTTRGDFKIALDISCYSLIAAAKRAEPLLAGRYGSVLTLSYLGSEVVIPNYKVMGVAKAALEASVRYLAYDLGEKKIRVNAISAGPIKTLAAAGISDFKGMLQRYEQLVPMHEAVSQEDCGALAGFLCSDHSRHITGQVIYLDSGASILGMTPTNPPAPAASATAAPAAPGTTA